MDIKSHADTFTDTAPKNIILYGAPGVGKTTLAASIVKDKKTLFIDTETGSKYLDKKTTKNMDVVDMKEWFSPKDKMELFKALDNYEALVIDSVGMLQEYLMRSDELNSNHKKADGTISQQGYGYIKNAMNKLYNALYAKDLLVISVCHQQEKSQAVVNGEMVKSAQAPKIMGSFLDDLFARSELVGYLKVVNRTSGKKKVKDRVLQIDPSDNTIYSKDRPSMIGDKVEISTDDFIKILNK